MKKLLALVLCVVLLMCMVGCDSGSTKATDEDDKDTSTRIVKVYDDHPGCINIYVDTETRVMYMVCSVMDGIAIQVMVDANGNPLLWEGDL